MLGRVLRQVQFAIAFENFEVGILRPRRRDLEAGDVSLLLIDLRGRPGVRILRQVNVEVGTAQLHALDHGYTYGLLWVAGVAVLTGAVALFIGYSAKQVAHAQEVQHAIDVGEI